MPAIFTVPDNYKPRTRDRVSPSDKIITYDSDNAYPQRVAEIADSSPTASACIAMLARFLVGRGFEEQVYRVIVNKSGQTLDELLRQIALDFAKFSTFAVHVNYNLAGQAVEFTRIDPRYCRLGHPDSDGYSNKIAIYNDWARDNYKVLRQKYIDYIDVFNPDPEIVQEQISIAGNIWDYKGQVLYYTGLSQEYPKVRFDSVLPHCEAEGLIGEHDKRSLKRGFLAKQILFIPQALEEEDQARLVQELAEFQGAEGRDLMVMHGVNMNDDGTMPQLVPVNHSFTWEDFVEREQRLRKAIMRVFNQPSILHSEFKDTGLSSADQIQMAFDFYNLMTADDRRTLEQVFARLFAAFHKDVNPSGNYSILPLVWESSAMTTEDAAQDAAQDSNAQQDVNSTPQNISNG